MTCYVSGCKNKAEWEVIFYDFYLGEGEAFYERHKSCPFICSKHLKENEEGARPGGEIDIEGYRRYRGWIEYPHTKSDGQGFCIYKPLEH